MKLSVIKYAGTGCSITVVFAHGVRKTGVQFSAPRLFLLDRFFPCFMMIPNVLRGDEGTSPMNLQQPARRGC